MVAEAVRSVLIELGISEDQINEAAQLQTDLELDSTEVVQIALEMKRQFGVDVKLESSKDHTVGEVCQMVEERLREKAGVGG